MEKIQNQNIHANTNAQEAHNQGKVESANTNDVRDFEAILNKGTSPKDNERLKPVFDKSEKALSSAVLKDAPDSKALNKMPSQDTPNSKALNKMPSQDIPDNKALNKTPLQDMPDSKALNKMPSQEMPDSKALNKMPSQEMPDSKALNKTPLQDMPDSKALNKTPLQDMQDSKALNKMPDSKVLDKMPLDESMPNSQSMMNSLFPQNTAMAQQNIESAQVSNMQAALDPKVIESIVSRILVSSPKNSKDGTQEVRMSINDSLLKDTEVLISQSADGQLEVQFLTQDVNSFQTLVSAQDALASALSQDNENVRVKISQDS